MKKINLLRELYSHSLKKTLLIMRIAIIFLMFGILQAHAVNVYSQKTRISLNFSDVELIKVLDDIEEKSEYFFLYNEKFLDTERRINISAKNQLITSILDNILSGTDVEYTIIDRKIILAPKYITEGLESSARQQQNSVTGRVTDTRGEALPGVNVVLKGTLIGAVSNEQGIYTINSPDLTGTLVFTFIGYVHQEIPLNGRNVINITLEEELTILGDVVVTALGIQREAKTLTYSAQQVSGAEVMKSRDINFMNALSGKAAGLTINKSASGAGGSTRTVLRGAKSFNDVGNPLYVIDGVPITNRVQSGAGIGGGYDQGDGLSSLNPDDIESISVLKGANAAMLYGSQGVNGVVMITTKKGKEGNVDINLSNATTFESVLLWPELQFRYGPDSKSGKENWNLTPLADPGFTEEDFKDFLNTGHNIVSNISVSGGNNKTTAYFSYSNTSTKGIIPNNSYRKDNVTLRQSTKFLNDKITIGTNVMFTDETRYNTPANGSYMNTLNTLAWFPRNRDISVFRDEKLGDDGYPVKADDGTGNLYDHSWRKWDKERNLYVMNWHVKDHYQSNPWWIINKQPREDANMRVITSAYINWDITRYLKFAVKGNYDYAGRKNEHRHWAGSNDTNVSSNGRWDFRQYVDRMQYVDAILSFNNTFGDLSLNAIAGISYQETDYGVGMSVNNGTNPLLLPNEFQLQNIPKNVQIVTLAGSQTIKEGYFANASIGFKDMIFLDLSGRQDRSSTLVMTDHGVGYFYPAAGLSGIISEMVSLPDFITFGKMRGSYTVVANDLGFSQIIQLGTITNTEGGVSTPTQPDWTDGKPEKITSFEVGTDWRFLEGRIGFDFTYYDISSVDQRVQITALRGNGFRSKFINTGKITNKGIEILVDAEPVSRGGFAWNTSLSFSRNKNRVVEVLADHPDEFLTLTQASAYVSRIVPGGSVGDLYAYDFQRDDQGRIKVDKDNKPIKTSEVKYQGSAHPDFSLGWTNSFTYKRWSMGFLVNGIFGGKVVSYTQSWYDIYGVSKRTADARDQGYLEVNAVDPDGNPVTRIEKGELENWFRTTGGENGIFANYFYDRTNIRLTQFSLSYDVPVRALNLPLKSASVGLIGQNLLFLYKKAPYDPELTMSSGSVGSQAVDNFGLPSTRTYGFNIKVNF